MFGVFYRILSPAGSRARLFIFIFHRVLPAPDPLLPSEPDAERFERIVRFLSRNFRVLNLPDAVQRLAAGTLPAAAACITFDDGYEDNYSVAAPILKRHNVNATFFIATGYINGGQMWNDSIIESMRVAPAGVCDWNKFGLGSYAISDAASRVHAYQQVLGKLKYEDNQQRCLIAEELACRAGLERPSALMMTKDQVIELRDMGMEIGGHTISHPILARLDGATAAKEIGEGRAQLAEWLGAAPSIFAYPNGVPGKDYGDRDVEIVRKAGYTAAVSTEMEVATVNSNCFQLPRFTPWDHFMPRFALRCVYKCWSS